MRAATEGPLPAGQAQHPPQASGRSVLILLVLCGALLAINSPAQSFMAHDEGYYAQQARMMLAAGDWITQQWWGTLIYDRANGIQWLVALSQGLFGFGEIASRLPAMIGSLGSVLLLYSIARRIGPEPVALLAAAILAVTPIFMQASKLATQDVPLVFTELLAIWALLRAEEGRRGFAALAGIAFGLGFAIKSFMMLPAAAAMVPYLLWEHRRHRHLTNPWLWLGVLAGLLPTMAWLGLSYMRHGWFSIEAYFGKLLFLAGADFHNVGPFYYLWNVPANAFPWSLLAIGGAFVVWRDKAYRRRALVIGFPLVLFVELTSFTTRAWYYALQLLPMMSILAAACLLWLAGAYARRARLPLVLTLMMAAAGALALAAVPVAMLAGIDPLPPALSPLRFVIMATGLGFLAPLAMLLADRRRRAPWRPLGMGVAGRPLPRHCRPVRHRPVGQLYAREQDAAHHRADRRGHEAGPSRHGAAAARLDGEARGAHLALYAAARQVRRRCGRPAAGRNRLGADDGALQRAGA